MCNSVAPYLKAQMFDGPVRQWAASALMTHAKKYGTRIDQEAFKIRLDRDLKTKRLLPDYEDAAEGLIARLQKPAKNRSFVREEIRRFAKHQLVIDTLHKTARMTVKHDMELVSREFQKVIDFDAITESGKGLNYSTSYAQRAAYRQTEVVANGISTGTKLDNYFKAGGLWPKALHVVIAPYAGGKTSTMVSFARAAIMESNKKVLYVTVDEADEFAIAERFDSAFSGVSLSDIKEDEATVKEAVDEVIAVHGDCLRFKEYPPGTLTMPMLRGHLRQLERESFYPDLIVLDYADLMVPSLMKSDKEHENQGMVYIEARIMAVEEEVAVLTAAQLNREGMGKEITTGKFIAESIKKAHRADSIVTINQTPEEARVKRARLWIDKNRGGRRHIEIPVKTDWATQRVE